MKKKIFTIMAVVLVLIVSLSVFVACGKTKSVSVEICDAGGNTLKTITVDGGASIYEEQLAVTKTGYTLDGLYTDKEFTNEYKIGKVDGDLKLYAKFVANTYYITFVNYDGGEDIDKLTVSYDQNFVLPTPADRTGYVFTGWTLDGDEFNDDAAYNLTSTIRLRAAWSAMTSSVNYEVNGGDALQITQYEYTYGATAVVPAVTRTGYTFMGWEIVSDDENNGTLYNFAPNGKWSSEYDELSLKARWTAKETKLILNADNGEFAVTPSQDTSGNYYVNVNYDEAYELPVITKAGYVYRWKTSEGAIIANSGTWNKTAGEIILTAEWTGNTYYITFDDGDNGVCTTDMLSSVFGDAVGLLPTVNANEGYVFNYWYYMSGDSEVRLSSSTIYSVADNITAYAKYGNATDTSYKVEVYLENINDELFSKIDIINSTATTGDSVDATALFSPETYMEYNPSLSTATGDVLADGSLVLKLYYNRSEYSIVINENGGDEVSDITAKYGAAVTMPTVTRTGYHFKSWSKVFSVMPAENSAATAEWTANKYKLYLDVTKGETYTAGVMSDFYGVYIEVTYDGAVSVPTPSSPDYSFVNWKNSSDNSVFTDTTWNRTENAEIYADWTHGEVTAYNEVTDGLYFVEYNAATNNYTYVFVYGRTPSMGAATVEILSGDALTLDNGTLMCSGIGDCVIAITEDGRTRTVNAKVVEQVDYFGRGSSYTTSWANRAEDTFLQDTSSDIMAVGTANAYIPDLKITNGASALIDVDTANVIFTLAYAADNSPVDASLYSFVNGQLTIDNSLNGATLKAECMPKYALSDQGTLSAVFTFTVNSGVNVYDNLTLKTAYEDTGVTLINVLRDINVELFEDNYATSGGNSYIINDFSNCVYLRQGTSNLTIEGNYFNINGTSLGYFDNDYDGKGWNTDDVACIKNVQTAIFGFEGVDGSLNKIPEAALTINDMLLTGNNTRTAEFSDSTYNGKPIYKMSASFIGIKVENAGTLNLNNTTIRNTLIALFGASRYSTPADSYVTPADSYVTSVQMDVAGTYIDNSWANSIYVWGCGNVSLADSKLLTSSGAAVHFDDHYDPNYEGINTLVLDNNTVIENYVIGTEAWFVAYGMADLATGIKTQLNTGVNNASGNTLGIIKTINGSSCFNFAIFTRSAGGEESKWINGADKQGGVTFNTTYYSVDGTISMPSTPPADTSYTTFSTDYKYVYYATGAPSYGTMYAIMTAEAYEG